MTSSCRTLVALVCLVLVAAAPPMPVRTDRDGWAIPAGALVRLGTTCVQQYRGVEAVAFSPDGKLLAVASNNLPVTVWNVANYKLLKRLEGEGGIAHELHFSPHGKFLVAIDRSVAIVWNVATGKRIHELSAPTGISTVTFSLDGRFLAGATHVYGSDGEPAPILLWDIKSGRMVRRLPDAGGYRDRLAFSADGKTLAMLRRNRGKDSPGMVALWDASTGKQLAIHNKIDSGVLFPDGKRYTVMGKGGRIEIRDLTGKLPVQTLIVQGVSHIVSQDGKLLASMDKQQRIQVQDLAAGRVVKSMQGRRSPEAETRPGFPLEYFPLAFSPDGKILATGSHDEGNVAGGVRLWDVTAGKELLPAEDHVAAVTRLTFSSDGKTVASGSRDTTVRLWDTRTGRHLRCFAGHEHTIDAVALSPTGRILASSSRDKTVRLWDTKTGQQLHLLKRPGAPVASLCFLNEGRTLQVSDSVGLVYRYAVNSGKPLRRLQDARDGSASVPSGPDGLTLVPSIEEVGDSLRRRLRRHGVGYCDGVESLYCVRVSPDGRMVAAAERTVLGGFSGPRWRIRVWEVATGGLVADLPEIGTIICSLEFSRDGWGVFSGLGDWCGWGRTMAIGCWDLVGREVAWLWSDSSNISALALSHDGTKLASGTNATILLWDVSSSFRPDRQPPLWPTELACHWSRLGKEDARDAYLAMYRLASSPGQAVAFLRKRLRALAPPGAARLRKLIADLDDDVFDVRDKATTELARLGISVESELRRALLNPPSLEVRHRIEEILRNLTDSQREGVRLQILRGISVLERIDTAKAREVLRDLAKAAPNTLLGKEAEAALQRRTVR